MCCRRGFSIWCPHKDYARLQQFEWDDNPALKDKRLFVPIGKRGYRFGMTEDGACHFLDEKNLCRMHARLGFDAKTLTCKMYPYNLVDWGDRIFIGLLFSCPAVIDNTGEPVHQQRPLLQKLLDEQRLLIHSANVVEDASFDAKRFMLSSSLDLFENTLVEIFDDPNLSLLQKIIWASDLLDMLEEATIDFSDPTSFQDLLVNAKSFARDKAEHGGLCSARFGFCEEILFRLLQGLCSTLAQKGLTSEIWQVRQHARLTRLYSAFQFMFTNSVPMADSIAFRSAINQVQAYPFPKQSEELICRYLKTRYAARAYFGREGWGTPVLHGARMTLALPGLIVWYGRVFAALQNRTEVIHDDIREAVMLTDLTFGHAATAPMPKAGSALRVIAREGWPKKMALSQLLPR